MVIELQQIYLNSPTLRRGLVRILSLYLAMAIFFGVASRVYADDTFSPDLVEVSTPVYHPDPLHYEPSLGSYLYTVSWQGIPAAEVSVKVAEEGLNYRVNVLAKTYSGVSLLYKLRYEAEGIFSAFNFLPIETVIDNRENSRKKNVRMRFLENGEVLSVRKTGDKTPETIQFKPNNFMLDPFSAAFIARGLDWELGETKKFDVFNGSKSRYLVSLTAKDKIKMKVNDETKDVWVISPQVKKLNTNSTDNKLREAKIYVTADSSRDILKIVSSVFIGSVTTKLDSFTPAPRPSYLANVAQKKGDVFIK